MKTLKSYAMAIVAILLIGASYFYSKEIAFDAVSSITSSFKEMLLILPPVFILLGLLDVWVPRDTMVAFMGEGSGIKGALLAFFLGSAAAGPLYVVFPIAAAFMKKDVKFSNILILIGAWSTTKIPMVMFEFSALGPQFTLTRLALNIPIILVMTFIINKVFNASEVEGMYQLAKQASN